MSQRLAKHDFELMISRAISQIPSYREAQKNPDEIALAIAEDFSITLDVASGLTASTLAFLDLFGLLDWQNALCRMKSEVPDYFRKSLEWYLSNSQQVLSNWERLGTSREIKITNLLESAPHFLRVIEERRLKISEQTNIEPGYSRLLRVALVLIKGVNKDKSYFLHQWDRASDGYQIIGGRVRPDESSYDAARRELQEELSGHELIAGRDYELTALNKKPVQALQISQTYGALTAYEFWLYSIKFNIAKLQLSEIDRWLSLEEMRAGVTTKGKRIAYSDNFRLFEANIPGGLTSVPASINVKQTVNYLDFVEVKPRIFGISFDVKGAITRLLSKGRKD